MRNMDTFKGQMFCLVQYFVVIFERIYSTYSKRNFKPIALRKAKTLWSFGLSECNRVNIVPETFEQTVLLRLLCLNTKIFITICAVKHLKDYMTKLDRAELLSLS